MASISKRQQARNERELHDLLSVPGNSQCADCGAKNPSWASWNLGVFLCMRCASLHRKLGTHISKVKSLSMDTWSSDQVEASAADNYTSRSLLTAEKNMKQSGNNSINKIYNPKNKKPDMPLDADEVDSAMERFIRKKYQEKSLSDGRPEPPLRDDPPRRDDPTPTNYSAPQAESPPPPPPPKKGKFFGFGLRATSSALGLSKQDKKRSPREPRIDSTFHIPNDDYNSMSRMADSRFEMTDADLQKKLSTLRDMGFTDTERNTSVLRRMHGDVERTIETLVQLGPSNATNSSNRRSTSPAPIRASNTDFPPAPPSKRSESSNNPFNQVRNEPTFGLSFSDSKETASPVSQTYASNNPFGHTQAQQPSAGLEQSFHSLQLSQPAQSTQPLFPHSTGGYPAQHSALQNSRLTSMTPPVPSTQYHQGFVASPAPLPNNSNPFFQPSTASANSTGNNPYIQQMSIAAQTPSSPSPSTNPFMSLQSGFSAQQSQPPQLQNFVSGNSNPFGIPPAQSPQVTQPSYPQSNQQQDIFGGGYHQPSQFNTPLQTNNPFGQQMSPPAQQMPQQVGNGQPQSPGQFPNFQYGQTQPQAHSQPQFQVQSQQQSQTQNLHGLQQQSNPFQQQYSQQSQPLISQQTGRYDKNSIMALFNQPQPGQQPLASIPEPSAENNNAQSFPYQQQISPAPSGDLFGNQNHMLGAKRSSTMPVSLQTMHSSGGPGNRNPFFTNTMNANVNPMFNQIQYTGPGVSPGGNQTIAARHASSESVSINNLDGGRHSPDAFASLSARYMR